MVLLLVFTYFTQVLKISAPYDLYFGNYGGDQNDRCRIFSVNPGKSGKLIIDDKFRFTNDMKFILGDKQDISVRNNS